LSFALGLFPKGEKDKGETTFVPNSSLMNKVLGKGETTLLPLRSPLGISRLSLIDEGSEQEQVFLPRMYQRYMRNFSTCSCSSEMYERRKEKFLMYL
jgi:hypothetical protein